MESIADRTITEADLDNDGKISFDEFCRVSCLFESKKLFFFALIIIVLNQLVDELIFFPYLTAFFNTEAYLVAGLIYLWGGFHFFIRSATTSG